MVTATALAGGLAPFAIFHAALICIVTATVTPAAWSRRFVFLALPIVTLGRCSGARWSRTVGAAQPLLAGGRSRRFTIGLISGIGLPLGAATVVGGTVVADLPTVVIGTAQAVAAGAILAVLPISIIPYAFNEVNRRVAVAITLGVVTGYLLG